MAGIEGAGWARVVIDVDRRAQLIEGRVSSEVGDEVAFAGWLDLFRVIEEMIGGGPRAESGDSGG